MSAATVTSKGQITIPADVRQALQVKLGDRVEFSCRSSQVDSRLWPRPGR